MVAGRIIIRQFAGKTFAFGMAEALFGTGGITRERWRPAGKELSILFSAQSEFALHYGLAVHLREGLRLNQIPETVENFCL